MGTTASCDGLTTLGRKMPIVTHVMALGRPAIVTWCIRFEKMREGIVDFEKVRILRELTAQSGNAQAQGLLKQLDQHLSIFPKEKEFDENKISADVRKGNLIIRQLSDLLAK